VHDNKGEEAVMGEMNENPNQSKHLLKCMPLLKLLTLNVHDVSWHAESPLTGMCAQTFHVSCNLLQSSTCQTPHASVS
jgi:hypothetical protein